MASTDRGGYVSREVKEQKMKSGQSAPVGLEAGGIKDKSKSVQMSRDGR